MLTQRFQDALVFAAELHRKQVRKGTLIPYVSHLLAVCSMVLEEGGGEDEAVAALLHDAVEDQGGEKTLKEIHERFGLKVADIVESCSDTNQIPKPPWRMRKEMYLLHLRTAPEPVLLVATADKVHNARSIRNDLRMDGDGIWQRFKGGKEGTLWYYRSLVEILRKKGPPKLADQLVRIVDEIEQLAKE